MPLQRRQYALCSVSRCTCTMWSVLVSEIHVRLVYWTGTECTVVEGNRYAICRIAYVPYTQKCTEYVALLRICTCCTVHVRHLYGKVRIHYVAFPGRIAGHLAGRTACVILAVHIWYTILTFLVHKRNRPVWAVRVIVRSAHSQYTFRTCPVPDMVGLVRALLARTPPVR